MARYDEMAHFRSEVLIDGYGVKMVNCPVMKQKSILAFF